mgnify:CR=1 FL=1
MQYQDLPLWMKAWVVLAIGGGTLLVLLFVLYSVLAVQLGLGSSGA